MWDGDLIRQSPNVSNLSRQRIRSPSHISRQFTASECLNAIRV